MSAVRYDVTISAVIDRRYSTTCYQLYAGRFRRADEAVNDRLRRVGDREHAPIVLGLEFHPARLEPLDGVAGLKPLERADQFAFAAGESGRKLAGVEAGVRDVTATTTGDFHLTEKLAAFLQQGDLRTGLRCSDCRHETRRAATNHDNLPGTMASQSTVSRWRYRRIGCLCF